MSRPACTGASRGRGYYAYGEALAESGAYREADPDPREAAAPSSGEGVVVISGGSVRPRTARRRGGGRL